MQVLKPKHKIDGVNVNNNGINVDNNSNNVCNNKEIEIERETESERESILIKLNKTKLNNYFNYIYNNQPDFDGISQSQKEGLIINMKRLDIFISNSDTLQYLNEEQIQEIKIQYWVIKELYFSPYAMYLNKLTRDMFLNKYLLTKKYIKLTDDTLTDFVNYFIKILRKEFENNTT